MPSRKRVFLDVALLSLSLGTRALAQASPYVPLDDPRLPALEYLIARGAIDDPSPMIRPFRELDAIRALTTADTAPGSVPGRLIHALRSEFDGDSAETRWAAQIRGGGEAYTQKRRDPLHLGGPGTANPYLDIGLQGEFGPIVLSVRPAIQPSLIGDPDWPNHAQQNVTTHLIEGYIGGQFKWISLTFGQLERQWGPIGFPGVPFSDVGYERYALALDVGNKTIKLSAVGSDLRRQRDSLGQSVNRYYFAHRLEARFSSRVRAALWESVLISGVGRTFEIPFANPLSPSVLANGFGVADSGSNTMLGADFQWRLGGHTTLQAQLAVDDFWFNKRNQKQDRYAFSVMAFGPLGRVAAWRAGYTQVSSLALRTANPQENFTDLGVGIGRNFSDNDQTSVWVTFPVEHRFLLSPELTFQRQGEGRINDPYPLSVNGNQVTPMLFIGTVSHTYRAAVGVTGRWWPFDLAGNVGFHHVTNDQNRLGVTVNRVVARVQATVGWRRRGHFKE